MSEKIAVIGLGYVGLPLTLALAKHYDVVGYDINTDRVKELKGAKDSTREADEKDIKATTAVFTDNIKNLKACNFFIVTVPTPVDENKQPDLSYVLSASQDIGTLLKKGDVVVYESTVYPGLTEDDCAPVLEKVSGLKSGKDFFLGYSPERINPGDKVRRLETIVKVVAGQTPETTKRLEAVYGSIIEPGIHVAPTIKVAEAAKVIENTQRDLNIALMNELSLIFDRMGIRTKDVLEAAGTKWNFLKFTPGLVGGHCISVDPYYLTAKAEKLGYHPDVILSGRRVNDHIGQFIASRAIKMLIENDMPVRGAKIGVLGLTFKENVPDLRNSRVPDVVHAFRDLGIEPLVHDPYADAGVAKKAYNVDLCDWGDIQNMDVIVYAVPHRFYQDDSSEIPVLKRLNTKKSIFIDVKSRFEPLDMPENTVYWSL